MSPRPRSASDADILAAVVRAVVRIGPARLTLADIADDARLAPATLLQRFGSKRDLLLAALERGVAGVDVRFAEARHSHASPIAALMLAATAGSRPLSTVEDSAEAVANGLAFLDFELGDPDFHRLALEHSRRSLAGYRALIDDAIAAGELGPTDSRQLARSVLAMARGSLITWAVHRDGALLERIRNDLDALLAPHRGTDAQGPAVPGVGPRPAAGPRARHTARHKL